MPQRQTLDNIKNFLKENETGNLVYDYDKINREGFPINIIISERGQKGKTYGIKDFIFRQYLKHPTAKNTECLFLRSLVKDAELECTRFLNDLPPSLEAERELLDVEKGKITHGGKPVFCFNGVSSPGTIRGTRTIYNNIVWDEFNDSIRFFRKNLIDNLMNIISSADNPNERVEGHNNKKLWLLGNNRGLNHPLLIQLGIDKIEHEVTRLYDPEGNPFVLLLCPIYDEQAIEQIKKEKANDWLFQLNKVMGTADHIYFNQSDIDKINFIVKYVQHDGKDGLVDYILEMINPRKAEANLKLEATFLIDGNLINLYRIPPTMPNNLGTRWHVININLMCNYWKQKEVEVSPDEFISRDSASPDKQLIYTTNKLELGESVNLLPTTYKQGLIDAMADCLISFENTTSRQNFISLITR